MISGHKDRTRLCLQQLPQMVVSWIGGTVRGDQFANDSQEGNFRKKKIHLFIGETMFSPDGRP